MSSTVQKRGDMVGWCDYISYNPHSVYLNKKIAERTFLGTKRKYNDPILDKDIVIYQPLKMRLFFILTGYQSLVRADIFFFRTTTTKSS